MKRILSVVLSFLLVLLPLFSVSYGEGKFVIRNGICFGDNLQTVKKKEKNLKSEIVEAHHSVVSSDDYDIYDLYSWTTLYGIDTDIFYYFNEYDQLVQLLYYMGKGLPDTHYDKLFKNIKKQYGDPSNDADKYDSYGMALNFSGFTNEGYRVNVLNKVSWVCESSLGEVVIHLVRYRYTDSKYESNVQARLGFTLVSQDKLPQKEKTNLNINKITPSVILKFGHYPMNEDGLDNSPIEWVVLKVDGYKAYLLSKYILYIHVFDGRERGISWGSSSLRKWLNSEFLKKAFTAEEQKTMYKIRSDKVSALSLDEAMKLFRGAWENSEGLYELSKYLHGYCTDYALEESEEVHSRKLDWWSSTMDEDSSDGAYILGDTDFDTLVFHIKYCSDELGVRPYICVDLKKADKLIEFVGKED